MKANQTRLGLFLLGALFLVGCSSNQSEEAPAASADTGSASDVVELDADLRELDSTVDSNVAPLDTSGWQQPEESGLQAVDQPPAAPAEQAWATPEPAPAAPLETSPMPTDSWSMDSSGSAGTYVVQPGDTLMKIAFKVYGDIERWREIYTMNLS